MKSQKALQEYMRRRRRITLLYFSGIFMGSLMVGFYIWQYMKMMEIQMATGELQKQTTGLEEKIEIRQAERATLGRLERIEEIASRKLGMGIPAKEQMWYIRVPQPVPSSH